MVRRRHWVSYIYGAGMHTIVQILSSVCAALLAPIFTLGLFAAPLEVLVAIVRAGATKPYALLPYLTMQINCAVWCMYGLRIGVWVVLSCVELRCVVLCCVVVLLCVIFLYIFWVLFVNKKQSICRHRNQDTDIFQ